MNKRQLKNLEKAITRSWEEHCKIQDLLKDLVFGKRIKGGLNYLYPNDFVELKHFYNTFFNRDFKKALNLYCDLDSAVREKIPSLIANIMENYE